MKFRMKRGIRSSYDEEDEQTVLLNAYTGDLIKINRTGTIIFNLMKDERSFDGVLSTMCEMYPETDQETIRAILMDFIKGLKEHNIFEVTDAASEEVAIKR